MRKRGLAERLSFGMLDAQQPNPKSSWTIQERSGEFLSRFRLVRPFVYPLVTRARQSFRDS
jgi:hypothetical protein